MTETRDEGTRFEEGLLDTNVVLALPKIRDPAALPDRSYISTITLAELSVGPLVTDDPVVRAARQAHVQQAEADFDPIPFDEIAARAFGGVAASLRRVGRTTRARAYDAMIAAIAIANALPLYTANVSDFEEIRGLTVVAVRVPKLPDAERP